MERLEQKQVEEEVIKMNQRHVELAMALQSKAARRLQEIDPDKIAARDILQYMIEAAKLERLARGETTESIKHDFERLSDNDLIGRAEELLRGVIAPGTGT
jgi:hypothetical protein